MFIRITKSKNFEYVNMVKTYRDNGSVKHKNIASLGRLDLLKNDSSWKNIIQKLSHIVNESAPDSQQSTDKTCESIVIDKNNGIEEIDRLNWGYIVYEKIWRQLGLNAILEKALYKRKIVFNFIQAVFSMVIDRLLHPRSKLNFFQNQNKYAELSEVSLHNLYRSLDILSEFKEQMEKELFEKNLSLFNMKVDVVFYDVTTFYFESVRPNLLKDFGFGKDGKFNEVQVVLGLLIDQEGRPIGFDIFPGNTFEGKTIVTVLQKLKEKFSINRIIIVADRGLNSILNFKAIKDNGYDYIVGSRIKSLNNSLKNKVLDKMGYVKTGIENIDDENIIEYKIIDHEMKVKDDKQEYLLTDKIICTWSSKRAKKDKIDRERLVEKAQKIIETNQSVNVKKGAKRYINVSVTEKPTIDQDKIEYDEKWDGYYGIQTSSQDMSANEIIKLYHMLWKIEESFRVLKTTLETRPIFHWTEKRILGHFTICFIAFLMERTLELELKAKKIYLSPEKIREALNALQLSELMIGNKSYYLLSSSDPMSKAILKVIGIKIPKSLTSKEDFSIKNYLPS